MSFHAMKRIDETTIVCVRCDASRDIDNVFLIEQHDDDTMTMTHANVVTFDAFDIDFLRSYFRDEYAHEYATKG